MLGMFDRRCTVKRLSVGKDAFGTPTTENWNPVGTYPCRLDQKILRANQDQPGYKIDVTNILYLPGWANIQTGDLIEFSEMETYRSGLPYRLGNHHIEVHVEWDGRA